MKILISIGFSRSRLDIYKTWNPVFINDSQRQNERIFKRRTIYDLSTLISQIEKDVCDQSRPAFRSPLFLSLTNKEGSIVQSLSRITSLS